MTDINGEFMINWGRGGDDISGEGSRWRTTASETDASGAAKFEPFLGSGVTHNDYEKSKVSLNCGANQHLIPSSLDRSRRYRLLTTEDCISLKDATILWTKQLFEVSIIRKTMLFEKPVNVVEQRTSLVQRLKTHFNNYDL